MYFISCIYISFLLAYLVALWKFTNTSECINNTLLIFYNKFKALLVFRLKIFFIYFILTLSFSKLLLIQLFFQVIHIVFIFICKKNKSLCFLHGEIKKLRFFPLINLLGVMVPYKLVHLWCRFVYLSIVIVIFFKKKPLLKA